MMSAHPRAANQKQEGVTFDVDTPMLTNQEKTMIAQAIINDDFEGVMMV